MNDKANFLNRLLQSAAEDAPSSGAKGRALHALTGVIGTASTAAQTSVGIANGWSGLGMFAWASAATVAILGGVGIATYVARSGSNRPEPLRSAIDPNVLATADSNAPSTPPTKLSDEHERRPHALQKQSPLAVDQCKSLSLPDAKPTVCSVLGEPILLEVVNTCIDAPIDLYWINYECKEVFYRQLAPGETHLQATFATHPWRVRDHGTHRLLKEVSVSGSPLGDAGAPATKKLEIVVRAEDRPTSANESGREARCSEAGWMADLSVLNRRGEPIEMYWFDYDCKEVFKGRIEPGDTWLQRTQDAHRWHVRDANTHVLIKEFAVNPEPGAARVYLNVP